MYPLNFCRVVKKYVNVIIVINTITELTPNKYIIDILGKTYNGVINPLGTKKPNPKYIKAKTSPKNKGLFELSSNLPKDGKKNATSIVNSHK